MKASKLIKPMSQKNELDRTDLLILNALQEDAARTNRDLAQKIGRSPGPTLTRVKKLEEQGYILSYHARLNWPALGWNCGYMLTVKLDRGAEHEASFLTQMENNAQVLSLFRIEPAYQVGGAKYCVRLLCRHQDDLEVWLGKYLFPMPFLSDLDVGPPLQPVLDRLEIPLDEHMIGR